MESFDRLLEVKFNLLSSNKIKSVADKYPTNMLDIDFEDEVFKINSDWFIENETVLQKDNYYYDKHDETNTCIDIKLGIR